MLIQPNVGLLGHLKDTVVYVVVKEFIKSTS